ncbi:MAG TPA: type II toxin-antitoxin system PemK/MazF family toxin [Chloroflexota bacterium]|nr:type II toxin-antitoxin system PemK/MazF family toxin [Chloroflexota bacterium]
MSDPAPRRGEVWLARLDKVRPVVVLTRDPMGRLLRAVIAAPVTSTVRGLSTEVPVGPEDGVRAESVANLDNLQLVARARLVRRVGRARQSTISAICNALSIAAGCDH